MEARVSHLWRHPIKGHGVEAVALATFTAGQTMPWDRVWAIAHEAARIEPGETGWSDCANFARGAKSPKLMAIRAVTDEAAGTVTLSHPDCGPITVDPDRPDQAAGLIAWAAALTDPGRATPVFVVRATDRGMTDSDFPSIAILNRSSLRALSHKAGRDLAMERFRGNIWLDGLAPWEEFDLLGREITIGEARFTVRERITRCRATCTDPETGRIDVNTLDLLESGWDHTDFGVYAEVTQSGAVALGDPVRPAG